MELQDLLDDFNNGDLNVEYLFNSYENWFRLLEKHGLMDEVDPQNAGDSQVWQNQYLLWAFKHNKELFYDWIEKFLGDVEFRDGKVYWVGMRSDLSILFCRGRNQDISQDTIESILEGDSLDFDYFYDTVNDIYTDVIDELSPENVKILEEYLLSNLSEKKLPIYNDLMSDISKSQGNQDFWYITTENVKQIIDDEESMKDLLDIDELSELKSNLHMIYNQAYNHAYEMEIWEDIWSELGRYFEGPGQFVYKPHPYKKETQIESFEIPIRGFDEFITSYLDGNKSYGNSGTLEYHGRYLELLREENRCLSVIAPDYPSLRKIDDNINSMFKDYI